MPLNRREFLKLAGLIGGGPLMPWIPPQYKPFFDVAGMGWEFVESTSPPTYPYVALSGSGDEYGNILYAIARPGGAIGGGRTLLTEDLTVYVRTDGNDSNDGLTNDSSGAFATCQHAIDVVSILDRGVQQVTIQIEDGTYDENIVLKQGIGTYPIIIQGNIATPNNVILTCGSGILVDCNNVSGYQLQGFKVLGYGSAAVALKVYGNMASLLFGNLIFSVGFFSSHLGVERGGNLQAISDYVIQGGSNTHGRSNTMGTLWLSGNTVTLAGPSFGVSFVYAEILGVIIASSMTFSGTALGKRFIVNSNAVIHTSGGGSSYFPGTISGTTSTGGIYQ